MVSGAALEKVARWCLGETIGNGSYGVVRKAYHEDTKQVAAVKIVELHRLKKESEKRSLRKEIAIHTQLKHPNITEVYEVLENDDFVFIIMEYLDGGDLFHYVTSKDYRLPEAKVKHLFWQIVSALHYCHERGIVHRDLKLENFLLNKDSTLIKLTDFGFSSTFAVDGLLSTACGSPHYVAPEVLQGKPYDGPRADMWSLGITLFAMLTNRMPFLDGQGRLVLSRALRGIEVLPPGLSRDAGVLIKMLLEPDRYKRATLTEVMRHAWTMSAKAAYEADQLKVLKREKSEKRRFSLLVPSLTPSQPVAIGSSRDTAKENNLSSSLPTFSFRLSPRTTPRQTSLEEPTPSSSPSSSTAPTTPPGSPKKKKQSLLSWLVEPRRVRSITK